MYLGGSILIVQGFTAAKVFLSSFWVAQILVAPASKHKMKHGEKKTSLS